MLGPDNEPRATRGLTVSCALPYYFHTHFTLQTTLPVIPKAPFYLGGKTQ
jgi:hypothetical protein